MTEARLAEAEELLMIFDASRPGLKSKAGNALKSKGQSELKVDQNHILSDHAVAGLLEAGPKSTQHALFVVDKQNPDC